MESSLPDDVFLRIFRFLPFEDSVRVGRVSKAFRRISQVAVSRTKSLDLTEELFENLTSDQFSALLDLCAANLKRVKIDGSYTWLVIALADHVCPLLFELDVGCTTVGKDVFAHLIKNNPNLQTLIWKADSEDINVPVHIQYADITNANLEALETCYCNDPSLQSLAGHCPNLKHLKMVTNEVTAVVLDDFFAHIPRVETFDLQMINNEVAFEDLVHFWTLPLTSLSIFNYDNDGYHHPFVVGDAFLRKTAVSFPHLRTLKLWFGPGVTNASIAALKSLEQLQQLELCDADDADEGIRELAGCKRLQNLGIISSFVSSTTLVALVRSCPDLTLIKLRDVDDAQSSEVAAAILESLSGTRKRILTIAFHSLTDDEEELKNRFGKASLSILF